MRETELEQMDKRLNELFETTFEKDPAVTCISVTEEEFINKNSSWEFELRSNEFEELATINIISSGINSRFVDFNVVLKFEDQEIEPNHPIMIKSELALLERSLFLYPIIEISSSNRVAGIVIEKKILKKNLLDKHRFDSLIHGVCMDFLFALRTFLIVIHDSSCNPTDNSIYTDFYI